jgi:hypothetical protein
MDLSIPVATAFALLSALHIYWALGGRSGAIAALPERDGVPLFRPGLASTLVVAGLLASSALLVLAHAGRGPGVLLPDWIVTLGVPVVAVVMLARSVGDFRYIGFFKKVRDTRFARLDTRYFSPIALLLGAATASIAWSGP